MKTKFQKLISFPGPQNTVKEMVLSDELGKGQFGTVYLAYSKDDPDKIYAIKSINRSKIKG
jgi:hypothetical protein